MTGCGLAGCCSRLVSTCFMAQVQLNVNVFLRSLIQIFFTLGFMVSINLNLASRAHESPLALRHAYCCPCRSCCMVAHVAWSFRMIVVLPGPRLFCGCSCHRRHNFCLWDLHAPTFYGDPGHVGCVQCQCQRSSRPPHPIVGEHDTAYIREKYRNLSPWCTFVSLLSSCFLVLLALV